MELPVMIERGMAELGVDAPPDAPVRLARYLALLAKWNRAYNLTAITAPEDMVARHVLDSLAGGPWLAGRDILDIGSGAGLPGIPLAIADPSRRWVLLDSRGKRIQFLTFAVHDLGLDNVRLVQARFEKYRPEGKFDTLTARAFAALPELVRRSDPFITSGARLVAWAGSDPTAELESAFAGQPIAFTVHAVRVPGIEARRHIAVVERRR